MKKRLALVTISVLAAARSHADPYVAYWNDGKAELDGYELTQPRYGETRKGRVVLIYVTEPFSRARHVKVDRFDAKDADQLDVLKLNVVRAFQTGIYDYRAMTSLFTDPGAGFAPLKITFAMQEWCGHVYESEIFDKAAVEMAIESYFEGETGKTSVSMEKGALAEDALMVSLRSLRSDQLSHEGADVKMLSSPTYRRLHHKPASLHAASIRWSEKPHSVTVPAGSFEVLEASYAREDGATVTYQIETAYPHRIVAWSVSDGESARLTGSTRIAYWQTNREGDEKYLKELGLRPMSVAP